MVIRIRSLVPSVVLLALCLCLLFTPFCSVRAQVPITYSVNQEWVKVWINKDGSIDVAYNITLTYLSGEPAGIVTVGMSKDGYQIDYARDLEGNSLENMRLQGDPRIDVYLKGPIVLNRPYSFLVYAIVPDMVHQDREGRVGMEFYPSTFSSASNPIGNVRVAIGLPEGVLDSEIEYPTGWPFDDVSMAEGSLQVYWERTDWPQAQELRTGVSFPEEYVDLVDRGPDIWFYFTIAVIGLAIVGVLLLVVRRLRKAKYERPKISIEALGAARGLTAVEAAVVVGVEPVRVLTMVLYGMLRKRFVVVKEAAPLIKVEVVDATHLEKTPPRYYEIDFLKAIGKDGTLNERVLARTFLSLRDNVDRRMRGYSRNDTVNYYKSIVNNAWSQVTQAATPELKGDAIENHMEWLLMDESYGAKFSQVFLPGTLIIPRPGWWWYWYGPNVPRGPTSTPTVPLGTPTEVNPIPAQEWANNIVRGLETTTNNMVKNIQDFTNRLVTPRTAQSSKSVRQGSSCVCACATCACACACVGCACACAGGGAR